MDSTLRPRDIQARIRAGETPETVAQVAGTSVVRLQGSLDLLVLKILARRPRAEWGIMTESPASAAATLDTSDVDRYVGQPLPSVQPAATKPGLSRAMSPVQLPSSTLSTACLPASPTDSPLVPVNRNMRLGLVGPWIEA